MTEQQPEREHPGTGQPMEAVQPGPDGRAVVTGDGTGQALPPVDGEETAADDTGEGDELAGEEVDDDDLDDGDEDQAGAGD
jgi:hypothetical protein